MNDRNAKTKKIICNELMFEIFGEKAKYDETLERDRIKIINMYNSFASDYNEENFRRFVRTILTGGKE